MTHHDQPTGYPPPAQSLWLVVHWGGRSACFEFPVRGDRCIIAGSAPFADLPMGGVPSIAFQLERDGAGLRLTPGYANSQLRVDGQRVEGSSRIRRPAIVELLEHRLHLQLDDTPPIGFRPAPAIVSSELPERRSVTVPESAANTTALVSPISGPTLRQQATLLMPQSQSGTTESPAAHRAGLGTDHAAALPERAAPRSATPATQCIEALPIVGLANQVPKMAGHDEIQPNAHPPATMVIDNAEVMAFVRSRQQHPVPALESSHLVPVGHAARPELQIGVAPKLNAVLPLGVAAPVVAPSYLDSGRGPSREPSERAVSTPQAAPNPAVFAAMRADARAMPAQKPASASTVVELAVVNSPARARSSPVATDAPVVRSASVSALRRHTNEGPNSALRRLGLLTKRYPVGVFGGAVVVSLLVGVFLVGFSQIVGLSLGSKRGSVASSGEVPSASIASVRRPAASVVAAVAVERSLVVAPAACAAPRSPAVPIPSVDALAAATPNVGKQVGQVAAPVESAASPDPEIAAAMGHLFAGRLPEAEHAYRTLSQRYPQDRAFGTVARLLARRNGPDCRPGSLQQKSCPTVKP